MDFERRIKKLELTNRFLLSAIALISLLALYGFATRVPAVVKAERFELVDPYGTVRAVLGQDKDHTVLKLADRSGNVRLEANAGDLLTECNIYDPDGNPQIGVSGRDVIGGGWDVYDVTGKERAELLIDAMGARLNLIDAKDNVRAMLQQDNAKGGLLEMLDEKHNTTASIPAP